MDKDKELILWFDEIGIDDVPLVGGKNASLGEMYQKLTDKGVNIPGGFAITAYALRLPLPARGGQHRGRHQRGPRGTGHPRHG